MRAAGSGSTCSSTKCSPAASGAPGSSCGAGGTAGSGCGATARARSGSGCWSSWDDGLMSVVLVLHEPRELVNIAHVVRAMKNFGCRDLRLVAPREYDAFRIEGIAHQTQDVLARVRLCDGLEAALGDCVHVVGFTARGRTAKRNVQRPREAAAEIASASETGPVALLFGREDKGLTNAALDRCHRVVTIPSDPAYPSLKLPRRRAAPAPGAELERLFADIERALGVIEFFKTRDAEHVVRTVREVIHRVPLDEREVKLLRAMAIEVVKYSERLARSGLHVDR